MLPRLMLSYLVRNDLVQFQWSQNFQPEKRKFEFVDQNGLFSVYFSLNVAIWMKHTLWSFEVFFTLDSSRKMYPIGLSIANESGAIRYKYDAYSGCTC